jgi:hypothetical protein
MAVTPKFEFAETQQSILLQPSQSSLPITNQRPKNLIENGGETLLGFGGYNLGICDSKSVRLNPT